MKRKIYFSPAFDKRDPDPSKNYGTHGVDIRFVMSDEKGAIQFLLYTNWQLPHIAEKQYKDPSIPKWMLRPMPADIGYHSPKPIYEGQGIMAESCEYLDGRPCYYDGSSLQADVYFDVLVTGGDEALWNKMEEYHKELFD